MIRRKSTAGRHRNPGAVPAAESARPLAPSAAYPLLADEPESAAFFNSRWRPPIMLLVLGAAVRAVQFYFLQRNDPSFGLLLKGLDSKTYDDWALRILEGDWLSRSNAVFYMGPLYAYVLAAIYGLFGHHYPVGYLAMFLLGLGGSLAAYWAGSQWFSRRVAFVGALAASLCPQILFHDGTLLPEALVVLLTMAFLLAWGRLQRHPRRWNRWLILGLALGLASIQRGNMLLCGAAVALWLPIALREWSWRDRALGFALFLAGIALSLTPATLHNRLIGGSWVLITSNGPVNFYIGNGLGAAGVFSYPPNYNKHQAELSELSAKLEAARRELAAATAEHARAAVESRIVDLQRELSGFWRRAMLGEIARAPGAWSLLMLKKLYMFWAEFDVPDNYSFALSKWFSPLLRWNPLRFDLFVALGAIGIFLTRRAWRGLFAVHAFLMVFCLSVILVFVSGRFRLPVVYVCGWFAAASFWIALRWIAARRFAAPAAAALAAGCMMLALNAYTIVPYGIATNEFTNSSIYYQQTGRIDEGCRLLDKAVAFYRRQAPPPPDRDDALNLTIRTVQMVKARLLLQANRLEEAELLLVQTVQAPGAQLEDVELLMHVYIFRGKPGEAQRLAQAIVRQNPNLPAAQRLLQTLRQAGIEPLNP